MHGCGGRRTPNFDDLRRTVSMVTLHQSVAIWLHPRLSVCTRSGRFAPAAIRRPRCVRVPLSFRRFGERARGRFRVGVPWVPWLAHLHEGVRLVEQPQPLHQRCQVRHVHRLQRHLDAREPSDAHATDTDGRETAPG
eukprot:1178665-Prorocentrum_minimum.AAC.1